MIAAAPSTSNILKELLTSQKDEHDQQQRQEQEEIQHQEEQEEVRPAQQQQSAEEHQFEDLDKEGRIYLLGNKKFSGKELSDVEKNYLRSITNEGTIKSCIQFLAAQRLLLDDLDVMDTIIAKLGISRIVNAINPTIRNLIYSNLNDNEKQFPLMKSAGTSLTGLEPDLCTVIDNIIKVDESGKPKMCSMEDMDELFEQIQAKKTESRKSSNEIHCFIKFKVAWR